MLREMLEGARHHQFNCNDILYSVGIDTQTLATAEDRLSLTKCAQLLRQLWLKMEDECAGALSRPAPNGTFAVMTYAALSADTLREALQRAIQSLRLIIGDELLLSLQEQGPEAKLSVSYKNPHQLSNSFFILSWFVILLRFSSWLTNRPVLLEQVIFEFPPPQYAREMTLMFPCIIYFDKEENCAFFNRNILDAKLVRDNSDLRKFLKQAPENLLTQFRGDSSLAGQIALLLQQTEQGWPTFDKIAQQLNSTTYTLRRRLKKEGTSFQQLKDSAHKNIAQHHLLHTDMPIAEIAGQVGYSEAAAFNHAFRNWTGMTPGKYRKQFKRA